jgi:signal-transduction protein with cAMP-binding, CBS, and nucleotidyltransferase domain
MYCRVVPRPAGCVIVGKVHKREHFYMVVKGAVAVVQDGAEEKVYEAPAIIVSRAGTKRAVVALVDSVCLTVHRTDETDLDKIEAELIEHDPTALFDAHNRLRELEHDT